MCTRYITGVCRTGFGWRCGDVVRFYAVDILGSILYLCLGSVVRDTNVGPACVISYVRDSRRKYRHWLVYWNDAYSNQPLHVSPDGYLVEQ